MIIRGNLSGAPITQVTSTYDSATSANSEDGDGYLHTFDFNRALDAAMEKVYDKLRGNSNFIVDMAESAATVKMLRNIVSFRKLASDFFKNVVKKRAYRRIKPGPTQGQLRLDYVTGKWLEYRYGWMPLMYSIYDAIDTINMDVANRSFPVTASSSFKSDNNSKRFISGSGSYTNPIRHITSQKISTRVRVGFLFQRPSGYVVSDWTSLNPLAIAWELTPLSFVADWFVNVSEVLSSWENFLLFQQYFKGGYISRSGMTEESFTGFGQETLIRAPGEDGDTYRYYSASSTRKIVKFDRSTIKVLPVSASIRVKIDVNQKRALDGLALIVQIFAKPKR